MINSIMALYRAIALVTILSLITIGGVHAESGGLFQDADTVVPEGGHELQVILLEKPLQDTALFSFKDVEKAVGDDEDVDQDDDGEATVGEAPPKAASIPFLAGFPTVHRGDQESTEKAQIASPLIKKVKAEEIARSKDPKEIREKETERASDAHLKAVESLEKKTEISSEMNEKAADMSKEAGYKTESTSEQAHKKEASTKESGVKKEQAEKEASTKAKEAGEKRELKDKETAAKKEKADKAKVVKEAASKEAAAKAEKKKQAEKEAADKKEKADKETAKKEVAAKESATKVKEAQKIAAAKAAKAASEEKSAKVVHAIKLAKKAAETSSKEWKIKHKARRRRHKRITRRRRTCGCTKKTGIWEDCCHGEHENGSPAV